MQISLKTKLGNCKLVISAQLRKLSDEMTAKLVTKALQFIVWHEIPAKAFAKDEPFKRDSAYSEDLEAHLITHGNAILAPFFEEISWGTGKVEKLSPYDKAVKEFISLGLSEDDAKAMAKTAMDKIAASKTETAKVETKVETAVAA